MQAHFQPCCSIPTPGTRPAALSELLDEYFTSLLCNSEEDQTTNQRASGLVSIKENKNHTPGTHGRTQGKSVGTQDGHHAQGCYRLSRHGGTGLGMWPEPQGNSIAKLSGCSLFSSVMTAPAGTLWTHACGCRQ